MLGTRTRQKQGSVEAALGVNDGNDNEHPKVFAWVSLGRGETFHEHWGKYAEGMWGVSLLSWP